VPRVAADPVGNHVGDHGAYAERLAWERQTQRVTHEAAPAVCTNHVASGQRFFPACGTNARRHARVILFEAYELATEVDCATQLGKACKISLRPC